MFLQSNKVIYTSYCRTAIYLALLAIGVKKREVIIPAFTCATTLPDAIVQAGGIPIFVDISTNNLNIDLLLLNEKISSKTRAIISHHYYGYYSENIESIQEIAKKKSIIHIEDCAHSLGATYSNGEDIGSIGDIAVFSFSKYLNCPGGGGVIFKDEIYSNRACHIQKKYANIFHSFIMNTEAFTYQYNLIKDRHCSEEKYKKASSFSIIFTIKRILIKILKIINIYKINYFYSITSEDIGKRFDIFDTRMTQKQKISIDKRIGLLEKTISERRKKSILLNEVIPAYFMDIEHNVFTNYVISHNNVEDLSKTLHAIGVKTRRVWPYFQKYWSNQLTKNVLYVGEHLLLVDIDCINHENIKKLQTIRS